MRKRLGAIHSDSLEEFIQLAQQSWEKDLLFYDGQTKRTGNHITEFDYCEQDTNTSLQEEETKQSININIIIVDNLNQVNQVYDFCQIKKQYQSKNYLDYCSKYEETDQQEIHFHFWILNPLSSKYDELIELYLKKSDTYIYIYDKNNEQDFQNFILRISKIHQNPTIYKVIDSFRVSSVQSFQSNDYVITIRNLQNALQRAVNKYI